MAEAVRGANACKLPDHKLSFATLGSTLQLTINACARDQRDHIAFRAVAANDCFLRVSRKSNQRLVFTSPNCGVLETWILESGEPNAAWDSLDVTLRSRELHAVRQRPVRVHSSRSMRGTMVYLPIVAIR